MSDRFAGMCEGGPADGQRHVLTSPWLIVAEMPPLGPVLSPQAVPSDFPVIAHHRYEHNGGNIWVYRGPGG